MDRLVHPVGKQHCGGSSDRCWATLASTWPRSGYFARSAAAILARASRTRGEQATVFSLKSSRSPCRPPSGGWYACIRLTAARGSGVCCNTISAIDPPRPHCFRMAEQSFRLGQCDRGRSQLLQPASVYSCTVISFKKSITLSPPRTCATPPVGRVWLGPET